MNYTELINEIEKAPQTQLPGLLITVLKTCKKKEVFISDSALVDFVVKALRKV